VKESYVAMQLESFSMSETIDIRKNGFPIRIPHDEFIERYYFHLKKDVLNRFLDDIICCNLS